MISAKRWCVAALASLLVATAAAAAPAAPAAAPPGHAGIASASALATEAGLEVLRKGGNAFDAAVAVGATLSVVEPESSGIGGGFFAVLHRASDGHQTFIDAREVAPCRIRRKVGDAHQMHPRRARDLREIHPTRLSSTRARSRRLRSTRAITSTPIARPTAIRR